MSNDQGTGKSWTIRGGVEQRVEDYELRQLDHGELFLRLHSHQMGPRCDLSHYHTESPFGKM